MITGAGIFIIELYKSVPVVVLFGLNKTNFSDPGGLIDYGETVEQTACRECREETANLINIKPHELTQISFPIIAKQYKSYIIYIQNLSSQDYIHNANQIFNTCYSDHWKETNTITRINLYDIMNAAESYSNFVYDIYGGQCVIRERVMDLLRVGGPIFTNSINNNPIIMARNLVMTSRLPCLIGTYSYTIAQQNIINIPIQQNIINIQNNKKYAIYVISKNSICNDKTKLYIKITNFSKKYDYDYVKQCLITLTSMMSLSNWKVETKYVKIKNNTLYFKSKTLDKITKYLNHNKFEKINGPVYTKKPWHIKMDCDIPKNIIEILKDMKFYLCIVSKKDNKIKIHDKIKLRKIK